MGLDHQPADRVLLEGGSATIEGTVALGLAFLLLTLLVQVATAMTARSAAGAAVAASARRASLPGFDAAGEEIRLGEMIEATVPGARRIRTDVRARGDLATALVRFEWRPPGPVWRTFVIRVRSDVPLVVSP